MNKLFTKVAALSVGLAMAIGVGVQLGSKSPVGAKAAEGDVVYTLDGSTTTVATSTTYGNYADATNKWTMTCGNKSTSGPKGMWFGVNNNNKAKMILSNGSYAQASAIATAIGVTTSATYYSALFQTGNALSNIGSVVLTYNSVGGTAPSEAWIVYSTNSGSTWQVFQKQTTLDASGTTFTHATVASALYGLVIHCTAWGNLRVPVLTFKEGSSGGPVAVTGVSLNKNSTTIAIGSTETLTATVSPSDATDKSVTWSSSNEAVATVSGGVVTPVDVGNATITVTTNDGNKTDDCAVTVALPAYTTHTVAQAIAEITPMTASVVSENYYKVEGYVINITTPYDSTHSDISFTIGDTANATDVLTCYQIKCSAAIGAQILKGAKVSLIGKYEKFVSGGNTKYEVVKNLPSQVTIISPGVAPQTYDVTIAEARAAAALLANNDQSYDFYTVEGTVNAITSAYSSGKISFTIGATFGATDLLTIYNLVLSAADAATVKERAVISVTGNLKNYNSTYEIVNGSDYTVVTPAPTYTVTYSAPDKTSGTVPTDSNEYYYGDTVTVAGKGDLAKTDYTFAGWSDGTNTYQPNETFNITSNTTLTAQWSAFTPDQPPYSADFTTVETHSYTQNKEFELSSKEWISSVSQVNGGIFYLGCNNTHTTKGVLNDNSTFTAVADALAANDSVYEANRETAHAYALLFDNAYSGVKTVTFGWSGGNNAFQVYLFGDTGSGYTLLASEDYATSGQDVSGSVSWTNSSGTTNFVKFAIVARPGTTSTTATNKTIRASTFSLAAQVAPTYTISYNNNGGSGTMESTTGTAPQVAACTFTAPEGKEFSKWNTESDGSGIDYAAGDVASSNITLYAIWVNASTKLVIDGTYLGISGEITEQTTLTATDSMEYIVAPGSDQKVKTYASSGSNRFSENPTILMGKADAFLRNHTEFESPIQQIRVFNNGGTASTNVVVAVGFGTSEVTDSLSGGTQLNANDSVFTFTPADSSTNYTYFRLQVTSSHNAQIQIEVSFKDVTYTAAMFAADFLETLSTGENAVCVADGSTNVTALAGAWGDLADLFDDLSDADKLIFKNETSSETDIVNAIALYDYVAGKYNTQLGNDYDFMDRNPTIINGARIAIFGQNGVDTDTTLIIVIASVVAVAAVGGYFFLRRKKEQ